MSYRDNEGRMAEADRRSGFYGGSSVGFTKVLEEWPAAGNWRVGADDVTSTTTVLENFML